MATVRNPQDSMKSTWRSSDRSTWNSSHWFYEILRIHPTDLSAKIPVHDKTDKMSYLPHFEGHKWVLIHACWPMLFHQLYASYAGRNLHPIAVFLLYTIAFMVNASHEIRMIRDLGQRYGFLDGDKHDRDQVPDQKVSTVIHSLLSTAAVRPLMCVLLTYHTSQTPLSITWWTPVEAGLYGIILDFWFYVYHRCMHDIETLWKFHRTHHLTKHPNTLLSLFADTEQEIFDIAVIPLLTWGTMKLMGLPMGFYDWWICQEYIVFTELFGHSGLRLFVTPPTTATPLLNFFDAEIVTEDHDLHHRKGWKKAHNYGKQTRLWDRVFGTCHERIESAAHNIDWNSPATLKLWWF